QALRGNSGKSSQKGLRADARSTRRRSPETLSPRSTRPGQHALGKAANGSALEKRREAARPGFGGALLSVWPLPAHRQFAARRAGGQSARYLERSTQATVGQ